MHAYVYKCQRKADAYVYLSARDAFDVLPDPVRAQLGALTFVLDVALVPGRRLARENPERVRANLRQHGFHLQMPATLAADPLTDDWGTDA
ncbi:YcgL domain-containing protein [Luteimonas deserti]|uniref:YcgL domain-containing protein n=1 Tax=Luteimonas deserti TaxID=2752306 RepID=A0A7Z0QM00_9GAMM|nr:YcgL domain-containing protein [Luteimonas deserti]NYZ61151.1 YcgL domain-containing protein [Luteimonas deserti]